MLGVCAEKRPSKEFQGVQVEQDKSTKAITQAELDTGHELDLGQQYFFFFLSFLGSHLRHMEVPRLGVKLEL